MLEIEKLIFFILCILKIKQNVQKMYIERLKSIILLEKTKPRLNKEKNTNTNCNKLIMSGNKKKFCEIAFLFISFINYSPKK